MTQAQSWRAKRGQDLPATDREFIDLSTQRESTARARVRHIQALVYVLLVGIIAGLVGWINQSYLKERWKWYMIVRPYLAQQVRVLSPDVERAVKARDSFRECKDCPEMIVSIWRAVTSARQVAARARLLVIFVKAEWPMNWLAVLRQVQK